MIARLEKLKGIGTKKVDNQEGVRTSVMPTGKGFPLVVEPVNSGFDLENWIVENRSQVEGYLKKYGAVLFRGFNINTAAKFQHLMSLFPNDLLDYSFRSSPRYEVMENIYVSTTYPQDQRINMHSENSYAPHHPGRIVFCCTTPAPVRGETPIADNRLILKYLSDELKAKFAAYGVQYRRNLTGLLGLKWQEVFQTSEKAKVEEECRKNGMHFDWVEDDGLVLTWKKKAIWEHPATQEPAWFNHGLFFNKYMLPEDTLNSIESDAHLPNNTFFGDGTEISKAEVEEIRSAYEQATVEFPWQKGDVLFLDNMLMSHGRNSYEGERQIIVSIS